MFGGGAGGGEFFVPGTRRNDLLHVSHRGVFQDARRLGVEPAGGESGVRGRGVEQPDLGSTQSEAQAVGPRIRIELQTHLSGQSVNPVQPDVRQQPHGGRVQRVGERQAVAHRPVTMPVIIYRGEHAGGRGKFSGHVRHYRGGCGAAFQREHPGIDIRIDASDRLVYDTASGALYYDADGLGGTAAVQFAQPRLLDTVNRALADAGLQPQALTLEITESVIMHDAESAVGMLRALKHMGVRISIDDFGTGYSSLSYLKRFPIDILKIDKSFVHTLGINDEDTAIVHAIMALAKSLRLVTIAEGVETVRQVEMLQKAQCDLFQGFHFSQPLDSDRLTERLAGERPHLRPALH